MAENTKPDATVVGDKGDTVTVQTLGDTLAGEMPGVSEHAIDAERTREAGTRQEWQHLRDRQGETFDPKLHLTEPGGISLTPVATK